MANCHKLFQDFNNDLKLTKTKRDSLIKSRDALREKIKKHFAEHHPNYTPIFFIQGSYKTGSVIRTKDDTCDLDDGIHFKCEPDVSPTTLQRWIYEAVEGHTKGGQKHKSKCVRVIYKNDYHIDLPIYKQSEEDDYPFLAIKDKDWEEEESDPKGFIEWYDANKSEQIVRTTRYLKAWGDNIRNNMPSGLAMTLFSEKYIQENERDDISLKDTLVNMKNELEYKWEAIMPVKPKDDILKRYNETFKDNFFDALDSFIEDAKKALNEVSQLEASRLWRKHLGQRFPLGEDENEDNKSAVLGIATSGQYKPYFKIKK